MITKRYIFDTMKAAKKNTKEIYVDEILLRLTTPKLKSKLQELARRDKRSLTKFLEAKLEKLASTE